MQTRGIILQLQQDNASLAEQLYQANSKMDSMADLITGMDCRLSLKDDLIIGIIEVNIENAKRHGHRYKKHTEEWKLYQLLIDKLIDIKQEINKNLK